MITIHGATTTDFSNNGLAVLEPISCVFSPELNGAWTLEMECPLDDDKKYLNLVKGNIIKITDIDIISEQTQTYQLFRIYNDIKTLNTVKIVAFPVALEATYDAVIEEYTTGNSAKTVDSLFNDSSSGIMKYLSDEGVTKYTVTSNVTGSKKGEWENTNLIALISGSDDDSVINKYNAEVAYDNYNIKIQSRLGDSNDYEIRFGKNLTGLEVDTDMSSVITRLYPISNEGIRLNVNNKSYVESSIASQYPFNRCAFVKTNYPIVDTNEKSYSNSAILTRQIKSSLTEYIQTFIEDSVWDLLISGQEVGGFYYEPEWVQANLSDIIAGVQNSTTLVPANEDEGVKNLLKTCIKDGISWIKNDTINEYEWAKVGDNYYYGNSDRTIMNQWVYVDRRYAWFDEYGVYHPEKDLEEMTWLQPKTSSGVRQYGNNKLWRVYDSYVYTMSSDGTSFNQYWFGSDGYWDGVAEESEWVWQQTDNKWWFGKQGATSASQYAHDCWLYIKASNESTPSFYYFDSDGYVVNSLTEESSWTWCENKGKWYFGDAQKVGEPVYLSEQWMKIDGEWYQFLDECVTSMKQTKLRFINQLVSIISTNLGSMITSSIESLYTQLYTSMTTYCENLFNEEGYDKPSITVTANTIDLSRTTEYKDLQDLEKLHLGDDVKVLDYIHYPDVEYDLRVVGLKYDVIRGYNTEVTLGKLSKTVSQMISSNLGGGNEQRLVAGDNVTIDGNRINVEMQTGDIYAGNQVSVSQTVTSGTELAKVYVDGVPTSIYGSKDVEVTRNLTEGTQIADIKVGNQHNYLFAPNGLRYWTETETEIYNNGVTDGMIADDAYLFDAFNYEHSSSYWATYHFKKANDEFAICATSDDKAYILIVSCVSSEAVDFYYNRRESEGWSGWETPINDYNYGLYTPCHQKTSFSYMGKTWYVNWSKNDIASYCYCPFPTVGNSLIPPASSTTLSQLPQAGKALIDLAHGAPNRPDKEGISNQDHILFYNSYPNDPNHEDDVYVSKSGVFHGTLFEDADGNPISGGGLSKTELYSASSYSSTVNLSSAYTGYQFLLIQTYNSDDKESLSTMLNVADLASGQRIGINDYLLYTITNSSKLTFYSSFDDTNHTRYIKGIYGLKTFNGSDVPNIITDVKVDNSSVVSGGVAQIDLTGKQDTLTAGSNININNNVISATDTTYSDFAGSTHGLVPEVQTQAGKYLKDDGSWDTPAGGATYTAGANIQISQNNEISATDTTYTAGSNVQISQNNEISATDTTYSAFDGTNSGLVPEPQSGDSGKYLKADGTWDTPSGGGGTTVIANPSGIATADLEKLQVGNDIYSIPSGGSGVDLSLYANWEHKNKITTVSHSINNGDTYHSGLSVQKSTLNLNNKEVIFQSALFRGYDANNNPYILDGRVTSFEEVSNAFLMNYDVTNTSGTTITSFEIDYWVISPKAGSGGGGGASSLSELSDVSISNPTDGQVLTYNATTQKWENKTPTGGGGSNMTPNPTLYDNSFNNSIGMEGTIVND